MSPVHEVLIEESVIGWKEFELEVMRDVADNFVVICSIENIDPMGVHTGDSITVAPILTLSDKEYQRMRDAARKIIRTVGVETGGSNIQFAVNPADGRMVVIEMNPRVSRSSALASKATGFPIAKIAAKLALGYHLDEIPNDITRVTPASFEPTIDYVVVKIPRWNFEKFPQADRTLTTQMKSVGEAMAIGRTFKEAFLKGVRSLELGRSGLLFAPSALDEDDDAALRKRLVVPSDRRLWDLFRALNRGWSVEQIHEATKIDPWFLRQFAEIRELRREVAEQGLEGVGKAGLRRLKRAGFGDAELALATGTSEAQVRTTRSGHELEAVYKRVDTCAAEFESFTPYLYSSYEPSCEANPNSRDKVVILGSGPNRIGQGIEFDYCCCHAAFALREEGLETVMVNCNPETVSTDYDTADRLYFEPLTFEDVMGIIKTESSAGGKVSCLVQFGGQTPLKLALALQQAGVPILGTSPDSIDLAEDRKRFSALLSELAITQPASGTATSRQEARDVAAAIGFPVVVRPSYVLGGRGMAIVYDVGTLDRYMTQAVDASPEHPVLVDKFLEDAFEFDVDAIADAAGAVVIGGIMEHIEEAGIHSGDSSCVVPPFICPERHLNTIRDYTRRIARALKVIGLMNVQYAIKDNVVYVLEVNPRASRTVPYLSKAAGVSLAKVAAKVMAGRTLADLGFIKDIEVAGVFVKSPVFPFVRFPGVDTILGPEMKSTGEVMGGSTSFGVAFAKAQLSVGQRLPERGVAFVSVNNDDKPNLIPIARDLSELGLPPDRDARHRGLPPGLRPRRRGRLQGERGAPEHRRRDRQPQGRPGHQHPARPRVVLRRPRGPPRGDDARGAVHHHADWRRRRGQRHSRDARARRRRPRAAGLLRRNCRHGQGVRTCSCIASRTRRKQRTQSAEAARRRGEKAAKRRGYSLLASVALLVPLRRSLCVLCSLCVLVWFRIAPVAAMRPIAAVPAIGLLTGSRGRPAVPQIAHRSPRRRSRQARSRRMGVPGESAGRPDRGGRRRICQRRRAAVC